MKYKCGSCHLIPNKRAEVSDHVGSVWFRIEKCGHQVCRECAEKYKAHYEGIKTERDLRRYTRKGITGANGKCLEGFGTIKHTVYNNVTLLQCCNNIHLFQLHV